MEIKLRNMTPVDSLNESGILRLYGIASRQDRFCDTLYAGIAEERGANFVPVLEFEG